MGWVWLGRRVFAGLAGVPEGDFFGEAVEKRLRHDGGEPGEPPERAKHSPKEVAWQKEARASRRRGLAPVSWSGAGFASGYLV